MVAESKAGIPNACCFLFGIRRGENLIQVCQIAGPAPLFRVPLVVTVRQAS
jgi:hypothetical protein